LTNSLYVPGKLSDPDHVVVDIGTGYFIKMVTSCLLGRVANVESDADKTAGDEILWVQGGVHWYEPRHVAGDDTKEAGKHGVSDHCNAGENTGTVAGLKTKLH
jgi:hypothetical protein